MGLENPDVIDIIIKPEAGKLELVITDAGLTPDPGERLQKLIAKLKSYVNFILSPQFAEDYPYLGPEDVGIAVVSAKPPTPEMRNITHVKPRTVQEWFIAIRFVQFADGKLIPWERDEEIEVDRNRILPRIVTADFLDRAGTANEVPHRPLGHTGLFIVYVMDDENSVRFIMGPLVGRLEMEEPDLYDLALTNLMKTFDVRHPKLRESLRQNAITTIKCMDTFDAARLLLIPRFLQPGEALAALVPDRDTLTLMPIPADGNWQPLVELAKVPASEHLLLDRPLKVTCDGFTVM